MDKPTIREFLFEVQLKTHLQFAVSKWSRASYKSKIFSWGLVRLISQTRALVEMAEAALSRIEESSVEPDEVVEFVQYERRNKIIALLRSKLMPEQLPDDMRRLAVTVEPYLNMFFNYDKLDEKQQIETMDALGKLLDKNVDLVSATSLTAYNVIFIVLFREYKDSMCRMQGDKFVLTKGRKVILITKEILQFCPELAQLAPECKTDLET